MLDFIASTSLLSSSNTGTLLADLLQLLHLHTSRLDLWNHFLRKLGHFSAYAVLGWLLFRAWRATWPARPEWSRVGSAMSWAEPLWSLRWAALAWVTAVLVASFDEIHQSFVPSRSPSVRDVALDSMGAMFALLLLMLVLITRTRSVDASQKS